jgi:hypothetical protein
MNLSRYSPIEIFMQQDVLVERYEPDFNDLAWQTFTLLTPARRLENPGPDVAIARYFTRWLKKLRVLQVGTVYANPCAVVRSRGATDHFLRLARRFQREWFCRFNDTLYSAERVRRQMNQVHRTIRQLAFTGVMIVHNRHVFPHQWPDGERPTRPQQKEPRIKQGERFGVLAVAEALSKGQVRCRCDCGKVVVKLRRHLVSGRTKSCGCLKAKLEEKLRNRRRDRS